MSGWSNSVLSDCQLHEVVEQHLIKRHVVTESNDGDKLRHRQWPGTHARVGLWYTGAELGKLAALAEADRDIHQVKLINELAERQYDVRRHAVLDGNLFWDGTAGFAA